MHYTSTRDERVRASLDEALQAGLAPAGGLYVPTRLPTFDPARLESDAGLDELAATVLEPFFDGSVLADRLGAICRDALDLPLPLVAMEHERPAWLMELFHGPTAAFKDFAARFLAACLEALRGNGRHTVLVATSGDTGAAVAAAFHRRDGFRVVVLYPDGRVSARQAHQLGAFGDNVHTCRVQGNFDDCQRMVKHALADADLARRHGLTSANSISVGRLLPQISYYALASLRLAGRVDEPIDFFVPTGNLGNALACILAREIGFPIGRVHLATNANRTLPEFFAGADYRGRPGLKTLANAMDVGDPSNFERLAWLYRDRDPREADIHAESVDDPAIGACIRREFEQYGRIVCPHTACALELLERMRDRGLLSPAVVAATAHPAKFETVIEPIIGTAVPLPASLAELLDRPSRARPIEPEPAALTALLESLDND